MNIMACSSFLNFVILNVYTDRSQWPRGLRGVSLAGNVGSNPADGMDVRLLFFVVCCQLEVSASG